MKYPIRRYSRGKLESRPQDLIRNLIGGFVIVADRTYQLGDRVEIDGAYGEIKQIGLRSTKLMTPDDTLVTVPNSRILSSKAQKAGTGVPECLVVTELVLPTGVNPDITRRCKAEFIRRGMLADWTGEPAGAVDAG